MQVVYSPSHLAHDITHETFMGVRVPANEVAERAEMIRTASRPTAAFRAPSRPSTARRRSRRSTTRDSSDSSRSPGPRCVGRSIPRAFLSADTYPNRSMFEGMSDDAIERHVREPVFVGGRAGFWGLDSAAPLVAGTYVASRGGGGCRA